MPCLISGIEETIRNEIIMETPFLYPLSLICTQLQDNHILPAVEMIPIVKNSCGVKRVLILCSTEGIKTSCNPDRLHKSENTRAI